MASPRLSVLGFEIPPCRCARPSHRLYELLARDGPGAHSRYNALVRRIVSFARAAEQSIPPVTGGATAVLEGWRASTIDVDLRFEPDSDELLREIPALKESLGVNIELASPPDFIPELPGWRERSPLLFRDGNVDVHNFDPYSQALSKIERGLALDREDVREMIGRGLVEPAGLRVLFGAIEPELFRYPAIDPPSFRRKVDEALTA